MMMVARKLLPHFFLSTLVVLASFFLARSNGAILDLPVGFSLSVRAASESYGKVIKADSTVDGHAFFVPFLISSAFDSNNSTTRTVGFALGFLFVNASSGKASLPTARQQRLDDGIYLTVCGGMSGDTSNQLKGKLGFLSGAASNSSLGIIADGYVVPMWIANRKHPLKSVNASLVIVETQVETRKDKDLRLQDSDGTIVWKVNKAGVLEMQDMGNFVVYDSMNGTFVRWQSNTEPTDTLLQGRKLSVGMELTSTSGDYAARMENGGLVLVLKNLQLADQQSCPYWIFPIHFRNDTYDSDGNAYVRTIDKGASVNSLISSSPCAGNNFDDAVYGMLGNASLKFFLEAGSCSTNLSAQRAFITTGRDDDFPISWTFMRLENDGKLYINAVVMNNSTAFPGTPGTLRYAFDSEDAGFTVEKRDAYNSSRTITLQGTAPFAWGECDIPMVCGSLGVCTTHASRLCSCPSEFEPIHPEDPSQGCMRQSSLPDCTDVVYRDTEKLMFNFLEMDKISSILMVSEWEYSTSFTTSDLCKKACSINCSCTGFFFNKDTFDCFFVNSSKLSLLNSTETFTLTSLADLSREMYLSQMFNAGIYTTYLKLNSAQPIESGPGLTKILASTLPAAAALLVVLFCCYIARRQTWRNRRNSQIEEEELRDILPLLPSRFSYKELQEATNGFEKLLGAGGCGSVYAGSLSDGRKVAVKVLESLMRSGQSKQFLAEVATVGHTNHLNVVRLVGFCWEVSHRLLVYEFVERGSLDQWLFTKGSGNSGSRDILDWQTRYNVALGIARGLSYLHDECTQPVLHFDIKPQNILLDEAFEAKLADFGMSRLMQRDVSKVVTVVRGTPGYIAPEWLTHGVVSKKSDVYSMGMVYLEIIGGRKNVDLALMTADSVTMREAWHFPSWAAKKCEQGLMMELVDKRLHTSGFDVEQVQKLIDTAFWCIQDDPGIRPNASTVLQWLESDSPLKQPPFKLICASGPAQSGSFVSSSS